MLLKITPQGGGHSDTLSIGTPHAVEVANFFEHFGASLPNTFRGLRAEGSKIGTQYRNANGKWYQIDYIALTDDFQVLPGSYRVVEDFATLAANDDHLPVECVIVCDNSSGR